MKYFLLLLVVFALPLKVLAGNPEPDYSDQVLISEFLPNPDGADQGKEWVELFNDSDEDVYLAGWKLDDESASGKVESGAYAFADDAVIASQDYLAVDLGEKNFALNNSGHDSVRLISPDGEVKQEVTYSGSVKVDESYSRQEDGSYVWTAESTKNEPNIVAKEDSEEDSEETDQSVTEKYSDKIKIHSLLANPAGTDPGHEWISLINNSDDDVNLKNWILDDGEKDSAIGASALKIGDVLVEAGDDIEIDIPSGNFALNNSGEETVRLFSPDKKLMDSFTYTSSEEDEMVQVEGVSEDLPVTGANLGFELMVVGMILLLIQGVVYLRQSYRKRIVTMGRFFSGLR